MNVLDYLKELDIKPLRRLSQLEDKLIIDLGREKAGEIISVINERGRMERRGLKPDDEAFYAIKHRDTEVSMAISGAFDGDIIRRILEWLDDSTVVFGNKVLDIGCENGIMTCYLAMKHPESDFLGIDRSSEAIACAEELKKRLNIENARFKVMDVKEMAEPFDTVICSRNIHENLEYFTPDRMDLFRVQSEAYEEHLRDYAACMDSLVDDGGEFIMIERSDIAAFLTGWLLALNERGMSPAEFGEIDAEYMGQRAAFHVAILKKTGTADRKGTINEYIDFCLRDLGQPGTNFGPQEGAMLLQRTVEGLIEGIDLYNSHDIRAARLAVWKCTDGMTMLERHSLGNGMHDYLLLPGEKTEDALNVIRNDARNYRNNGFKGEDLKKVLANQGLV